MLSACSIGKTKNKNDETYLNLADSLTNHVFSNCESNSCAYTNKFNVSYEIASTNDGYRFYVIIDKPRNAMYGIQVLAAENGIDSSINMAANAGIFEDGEYNMLPGQVNFEKGYVNGISVSGVTSSNTPTINVLVQWYSKKQEVLQEYLSYTFINEGN